MLYRIHVRWECWPFHMGDIFRLKALWFHPLWCLLGEDGHCYPLTQIQHLLNKCTWCSRRMLMDLACHGSNLNMQVYSGAKYNFIPNEQSCFTIIVLFKNIVLAVTHAWYSWLITGDSELSWAEYIWQVCKHIDQYFPNVGPWFLLKQSYLWLKTVDKTGLMMCYICLYWQLLPNTGLHL